MSPVASRRVSPGMRPRRSTCSQSAGGEDDGRGAVRISPAGRAAPAGVLSRRGRAPPPGRSQSSTPPRTQGSRRRPTPAARRRPAGCRWVRRAGRTGVLPGRPRPPARPRDDPPPADSAQREPSNGSCAARSPPSHGEEEQWRLWKLASEE